MSQKSETPVPVPNFDNAGFWEGCRNHELRIQRCCACSALRHHPRPLCPACNSSDYDWHKVSGRGTLYTFTIVHGPTLAAFAAHAPYNVAVVQLDEGPYLVTNIVEYNGTPLRIGLPVEVVFNDVDATISLPKFRPVKPMSGSAATLKD
ncbi:MAG: OB-fold domain-containing protein [Deltaproteobacteria bacterium]|nr:OB-fold domain-containing protein [Deltaproteobacteria bacterium]